MNEKEQTQRFRDELEALVSRYAAEYELSNAAAIGVLVIQILDIHNASRAEVENE